MPLSEQEQRLLEEMERNLYQNDADFVATVSGRRGKPNYTQITLGALLAIAGVGALVAGVIVQLAVIGVIGFGLMLAGVIIVITPGKSPAPSTSGPSSSASSSSTGKPRRNGSFMDSINERWERRQDGDR